MKKLLMLPLLCILPLLCGCASLYAQRREVEDLLVMETMGLDPAPDGVLLSMASSSGVGEDGPICCSAVAASMSDAMDRLQTRSLEEQLFCGHLQQILVGEEYARQGLEGFLATVCRSSDLRLDLPVYVILGGSAREAMTETGDEKRGIADVLSSLEDAGGFSTAGGILLDLDRQGAALVRTLRLGAASEEEDGSDPRTVVPEGWGILADGSLRELINQEDALGAALLTDDLQPCPLVLRDGSGRKVTLELQESRLQLQPDWDESGRLRGLELTVQVRGTLLEIDGFQGAAEEDYRNAITARMEAELTRRMGRVLQLSRALEADFLGLGRRVEQESPRRGRGLDRALGPLLPELTLSVTVQGELLHNNDIN